MRNKLRFRTALFGVSALMLLSGCHENARKISRSDPVPVKTVTVESEQMVFPIHSSGILAKKSEIKLSFKTGGIISRIPVDEGEEVRKGDLLGELDLAEIRAQANQAVLAMQKARRDYQRVNNLYHDSVATLEQLQNTKTALEVAINQDRIARFNLEYSVIRAPSDGRILKRLAEPNEIIGPGHPVFLFSSITTDWVLRCNLPDKDVVHLTRMDSARIEFDAYPGTSLPGLVSEIGEWADPYTGTYEIEILVFPGEQRLMSGFIGKANIYPSEEREVIRLPVRALVQGKGRSGFVYRVRDDVPVLTEIQFIRILDDALAVTSGLENGDEVIIEGSGFIDRQSRIQRQE